MRRTAHEDAARVFGFDGDVVEVGFPQGELGLAITMDVAEHEQRRRAGVAPLTDRRAVTALWELPHEIEISASALPTWALERVVKLGPAVRATSAGYRRMVRPPVHISGVTASGRSLPRLLDCVGQLSAVASMGVVVHVGVTESDPALLDAALYGVGVAHAHGHELELVLYPGVVQPTTGPFLWWVAELAYEQLLGRLTTSGPRR